MIELKNKQKYPVQLVIKCKNKTRAMTVLNIPGVGSGKNVYYLADERATPYIDKAVKEGLITKKYLPVNSEKK